MKTLSLNILFIFVMIGFCHSQTLTVKVSGIRNAKGTIRLAFFATSTEYKTEKPKITKIVKKDILKNGTMTMSFKDIPQGKYGVALLDDENNNQLMEYSFFLPVEGFGFSDYYHTGLKKPDFNNFCFLLGKEDKTILIKVRYM